MARHFAPVGLAILCCAVAPGSAAAAPPTIVSTEVSAVSTSSATLEASINPNGIKTFYHFEYGPGPCGSSPCAKVPIPDGAIAAGSSPVVVSATAEGLSPATTYHFRVVAKNGTTIDGPDSVFSTYSQAPVFGACPNDALRAPFSAALPDCRAYEQSSPVDKDGGDATGSISFAKATPDGDGVSFLSASGIPGGEGSQTLPFFLARRGGAGWSTQGLLPPPSTGQNVHILGWLPDFSEVFHQALKFGSPGTDTLLGRSSNGGALTQIAPYTPETNYDFAGASADGSEVVFETTSKLAGVSAALEGKSNVYAWSGGKLSLADVMNDGTVPAEGAFAGPYNWAKGTNKTTLAEGGAAREYSTQDEHAVSADGTVFFTAAGSGQLYRRVNPSAEQSPLSEGKCIDPKLACTLQVSATEKTNGKGVDPTGSDAAGRRPAALQYAAAGGAPAFFTSSEKLTNNANTGPEPELPAIARSNLDGSGANLKFLPADAQGIAIDSAHVYWADPKAGTIGRATLDGKEKNESFIAPGPVEEEVKAGVFEEVPSEPQWVAVDAGHVYWTNTGQLDENQEGIDGKGTIGRAKINGEEAEAAFIKGASNPHGIAVDAEHVYWANGGNEHDGNLEEFRGIGRAKLDGSEVITPWTEGSDGKPLGFATNGGLTLDSSFVYFTQEAEQGGVIEEVEKADPRHFGVIVQTKQPGDRLQGLAVQGSEIYWANTANSLIGRAKLNPYPEVADETEEEFIKEAGHPVGLAADGSNLYWAANQNAEPNPGNDLYRYVEGGGLEDITVDGADKAGAEVLGVLGGARDGSYVYFAANAVLAANEGAMGSSASQGDCRGIFGHMSGRCNLYVWHEGSGGGQSEFIARLDSEGGEAETDSLNWAPTPTGLFFSGSEEARTAQVSADGKTLLFRSQRQLSAYDNRGMSEFYRYVAGEPAGIECVSCNPSGEAPAGAPGLGRIVPGGTSPIRPAALASRNLSAGGQRVFFETPDALVGADTNGAGGCPPVGSVSQRYPACLDVYEWEAKGSGSCQGESEDGGCLSLISSGKEEEASLFADASESGNDVFFFTRSQLVGQDKDELLDVYDARVEGGLASQSQPSPAICQSSEACHGPASVPPAAETPASAGFMGPQNPKPKRAAKHKHHKKKQKKHKAHAKHKAGR